MSIDVRSLEHSEYERWNEGVSHAPHATPFHQYQPLKVVADETGTSLHLLEGYKGNETVGLFPLFSRTIGPVTVVYSPPLGSGITKLGPVRLNYRNLKQRKVERENSQFLTGCIDWIMERIAPDDFYIRSVDRYPDLRPFLRNGFDVTPSYTYVVDLTPGKDEVIKHFSSDARQPIQQPPNRDYEIREGGETAIDRIVSQVAARHSEQGENYELSPEYVTTLYQQFIDGRFRPIECVVDGDFVGGIITLENNDTVYRWQGGVRPPIDFPVNELLDWAIIEDAISRGISRYDMVGAMVPQLCTYKVKFAPTPVPVYRIRKRTSRMQILSSIYRKLPRKIQSTIF